MKVWVYPTFIFILFLYVMVFIVIYTYKINTKQSYDGVSKSGVTDLKTLKVEMMNQFK